MTDTAPYATEGPYTYEPSTEEVRQVQQVLAGMGIYKHPITGVWDEHTRAAIRWFQASKQIGVSGQIDGPTMFHLGQAVRYASGQAQDPIHAKAVEMFGPALAAYLGDPEVGAIIREAATLGYTEERLWGALEGTDWYRQHTQGALDWEELNYRRPAEADQQRRERFAKVSDQASRMGLTIDPMSLHDIVEDSLRFGWSETMLNDVLGSWIGEGVEDGEQGGTVGVTGADLRAKARAWHVTVSDEEVEDLAGRIARGEMTPEAADLLFRQRAKARYSYGDLPGQIDAGVTPEDYFAEHKHAISRLLGMSVTQIDFLDPKWRGVVDHVDAAGNRRPRTVAEAEDLIRTDDRFGYERTDQARAKAATLARDLREAFGGVR